LEKKSRYRGVAFSCSDTRGSGEAISTGLTIGPPACCYPAFRMLRVPFSCRIRLARLSSRNAYLLAILRVLSTPT
jgi:hypothetical protein